jgi:hypothetical protein
MPLQHRLDDTALHALSTPVHEPHFAEAGVVRGPDVLGHDVGDVARLERVEIEKPVDRMDERHARYGVAGEASVRTCVCWRQTS